jgi:hypothetical protein
VDAPLYYPASLVERITTGDSLDREVPRPFAAAHTAFQGQILSERPLDNRRPTHRCPKSLYHF